MYEQARSGPVTQETKALAGFPTRASLTNCYCAQQGLSGKQHAPPPQQSAAVEVACAVPSNASAAISIKRYFIIPPLEFVSSRPSCGRADAIKRVVLAAAEQVVDRSDRSLTENPRESFVRLTLNKSAGQKLLKKA